MQDKITTLGIHLSSNHVAVGYYDLTHRLRDRLQLPIPNDSTPEHKTTANEVIQSICSAIHQHALDHRLSMRGLKGVGITLPGPIDPTSGTVHEVPAIPILQDSILASEFKQSLVHLIQLDNTDSFSIIAENDANAHALFTLSRIAETIQNKCYICYVYLSFGLGGAFLQDGALVRGWTSQAGEIGHMIIAPTGRLCGCGGRGCLETIVSGEALTHQAKRLGILPKDSPMISCSELVERGLLRDGPYWPLFEDFGKFLGIGIASITNCLNPSAVVIGGPLAGAQAAFGPNMHSEYIDRTYTNMRCPLLIVEPEPDWDVAAAAHLINTNI